MAAGVERVGAAFKPEVVMQVSGVPGKYVIADVVPPVGDSVPVNTVLPFR